MAAGGEAACAGVSTLRRASFHAAPYSCDRIGPPRGGAEQSAFRRGPERVQMSPQNSDQDGRDRHGPDRAAGPVLQLAFVVRLAIVRPRRTDLRPGAGEHEPPPPLLREVALVGAQHGHLLRSHRRVVDAREERDQVDAARPLRTHGVQQARACAGVATLRVSNSSTALGVSECTRSRGLPGSSSCSTANRRQLLSTARRRRKVLAAAGFPSCRLARCSSTVRTRFAIGRRRPRKTGLDGEPSPPTPAPPLYWSILQPAMMNSGRGSAGATTSTQTIRTRSTSQRAIFSGTEPGSSRLRTTNSTSSTRATLRT
jgi:hypothetical protein